MKNHFMLSYFFNIIRTNLPNKSNKLFSHNTTAAILEALLGRGGVGGGGPGLYFKYGCFTAMSLLVFNPS